MVDQRSKQTARTRANSGAFNSYMFPKKKKKITIDESVLNTLF